MQRTAHILIFAIVTVFCTPQAVGQNVNIPDSNFKTVLLTYFDLDSDNEISITEAAGATFVSVGSSPVTDLTGLEAFVNAEYLTISQCPNLTSISLAGLSKLRYAHLDYNALTSVDLTGAPELYRLILTGNNLSAIDLSMVPNLAWISLGNNNLTAIDFTANTVLKGIVLINNQITSIDVSKIKCSLSSLVLNGNPISELDVSGHEDLVELFLDDMPSLQTCCVWPAFIENSLMNYVGLEYPVNYHDWNSPNVEYVVCDSYDPCHCTEDKNEGFFIPNVFSPNGDGMNDFFEISIVDSEVFEIDLYNRWGELILTSSEHTFVWGGDTDKGTASEGTYFYSLRYSYGCADEVYERNGLITLLR